MAKISQYPDGGTIQDADEFVSRRVGSNFRNSWSTFKSTLKTYFDTLYMAVTLTTQGDILYRDGSGLARLAAGTAGQVLHTGGAGANPSWANGGKLLQNLTTVNSAYSSITTAIPYDNTIPQITEGGQILSQAITPSAAGNTIRVEVKVSACSNPNAATIFALFDGNANAVRTGLISAAADNLFSTSINYEMTAANTNPITFTVRAGCNSGNTTYINGRSAGQLFNGTTVCSITVQEIKA